ncbi:hypothetical protein LTR94_037183, partial [Friedmanniomyces endolithicus]
RGQQRRGDPYLGQPGEQQAGPGRRHQRQRGPDTEHPRPQYQRQHTAAGQRDQQYAGHAADIACEQPVGHQSYRQDRDRARGERRQAEGI